MLDGTDLDADGSIDHENRAFDDTGDADGFADIVIAAGDIEEVNLISLVFEGDDRGLDRALSLLFVGGIVGDGVFGFDRTFLGDGFGGKGEGFDQGGLTAAFMS